MSRGGPTWTALLGSFDDPGTVTYWVEAIDNDDASSTSPTAFVAVNPCPG
ncbi:MAG: hypothetical protein JWM47_1616 [Acidimicrobiales bacterium]|nr:hypothetical protein [Acidimicrobiales bacterium]